MAPWQSSRSQSGKEQYPAIPSSVAIYREAELWGEKQVLIR